MESRKRSHKGPELVSELPSEASESEASLEGQLLERDREFDYVSTNLLTQANMNMSEIKAEQLTLAQIDLRAAKLTRWLDLLQNPWLCIDPGQELKQAQ